MMARNDASHHCGLPSLPRELHIYIHEELWSTEDTSVNIQDPGLEFAIRLTCGQTYMEPKPVYERETDEHDARPKLAWDVAGHLHFTGHLHFIPSNESEN